MEDAMEEVRAIEKISSKGNHNNLVAILKHGRLLESWPFYYIDMEFCEGNLEDYIRGIHPERYAARLMSQFSSLGISYVGRVATIWDIMEQIASGICFIHICGQVHRDLKPRNGI